jgi:hypothetical protein
MPESDNESDVRQCSDEDLLAMERSHRRKKTGDVLGTGLTAAAALSSPALWAVAGANAKSYLTSSSKHKAITKEMTRRGLEPLKEEWSDTLMPILTGAGSMYVGRALGGSTGQGAAQLLRSVGSNAFTGSSKTSKKDKKVFLFDWNLQLTFRGRNR